MDILLFRKLDGFDRGIVVFLTIYGLVLILLSSFHEIGGYGVETDFYGSYGIEARRMFRGLPYQDTYHGPGYAFVLGLLGLFADDLFSVGKMISIISAIMFGSLSFVTLRRLFGGKLAFFTTVFVLVSILPFPLVVSTDMFFAFLVWLVLYLFYRSHALTNSKLLIASGLVAGYSYLTRYDSIFLLLAVAIVGLALDSPFTWRLRLKRIIVFFLFFALAASPWLVANYRLNGDPFYNHTFLNLAANFYDVSGASFGERLRLAAEKFDSLIQVFAYDPMQFLIGALRNGYRNFIRIFVEVIRFPLYLFAVPGLLLFWKVMNSNQRSFFSFAFCGVLILSLAIFLERYYLAFLPFFILPSVYFFDYIDEMRVNKSGLRHGFGPFLVLVSLSLTLVVVYRSGEVKRFLSSEPLELKVAARAVSNFVGSDDGIVARKPHLAYLTGSRPIWFPDTRSVKELVEYAKGQGANYVLYSSVERELRSGLLALANPDSVGEDLEVFYKDADHDLILYRIKSQF